MSNFLRWLESVAISALAISLICLTWLYLGDTERIYLSVALVTTLLILIAGSAYRWQLSRDIAIGVFAFWIYAFSGLILALLGNYLRLANGT